MVKALWRIWQIGCDFGWCSEVVARARDIAWRTLRDQLVINRKPTVGIDLQYVTGRCLIEFTAEIPRRGWSY